MASRAAWSVLNVLAIACWLITMFSSHDDKTNGLLVFGTCFLLCQINLSYHKLKDEINAHHK